jgi:hypothetical protein
MSFLGRISKLTYTLLLALCLAFFSYTVFPEALYLFHKHFLGEYIAGLSLSKPLIFFAFLFVSSLARDLLPKKDFKLREWTFYQVAIVVCLLLVALFGFMVFSSHKAEIASLSSGINASDNNAGVWYVNYQAKTLFFYSISKTDHYHENKAYFYPLLRYTGLQGDIGESLYPFYPKMLMLVGYILIALAMLAFVQSLRQLKWLNNKLDVFVYLYYAFTFARIVHVMFDGGLFLAYMPFDLAAFFSASILIAYLKYPGVRFTGFLPLASLLIAPLAGKAIQWGFAWAFGVKIGPSTVLPGIFFFETLLIFSVALLLSQRKLEWRRMWQEVENSRSKALLLILAGAVAYLYVNQIAGFDMRTALDTTESYMTKYNPNKGSGYLAVTSAGPSTPCNQNPFRAYAIKGAYVQLFAMNAALDCQSASSKYYSYPTSKYQPKSITYVTDCSTAKVPYSKKGDICYNTIRGNFTFFQFEAAKPLQGQQVYWIITNAR